MGSKLVELSLNTSQRELRRQNWASCPICPGNGLESCLKSSISWQFLSLWSHRESKKILKP